MDYDLSLSKLRPAEPRGSIYVDEYLTEESDDEGQSPKLVAKKIKKLGYRKKKYKVITNKMREELIDAIENNNEKIKDAAKRLHMNYSSAKSILQVYKKEGRLNKKGFRNKTSGKNEFSEDEDEEFVEKAEFIKEESSAPISRKEIVPVEESEDEVQLPLPPPQKAERPQRAKEAKIAQLPQQKAPEKQISPKALQETINPFALFQQQQQQQQQSQYNYPNNLNPLSFFPSQVSSMKTNFANNSYFQPNSFMAGMNLQGAFPTNILPKDNFAFKTSNFVGGLQQKPAQKNFNSLSGTNLSKENPVFMQNLIQTNFFPPQYMAAGNRFWNPMLVGGNQMSRPASSQLVGNFGDNLIPFPKVEDFDI